MENLVKVDPRQWRGRSVFVTGHTGFKGGWLSLWLKMLGAEVHGFALDPDSSPCLFDTVCLARSLASDVRADLADREMLATALSDACPDVVFHLAAQPLVREGYRDPVGTFATNVMGTAHILEAARKVPSIRAIVVVTTDKVYQNNEGPHPYREADALGGRDPYSASKAAAELVVGSYRQSFFAVPSGHQARVATARAGNVIGGGDWAADRLVPDCFAAFSRATPVRLRYPGAIRPWQHVLEPLSGYLQLAQALQQEDGQAFAKAWNFGPDAGGNATVGEVATIMAQLWGAGASVELDSSSANPHEAGVLRLDSNEARTSLGWSPRWTLPQALKETHDWHSAWRARADMTAVTLAQIRAYDAGVSG